MNERQVEKASWEDFFEPELRAQSTRYFRTYGTKELHMGYETMNTLAATLSAHGLAVTTEQTIPDRIDRFPHRMVYAEDAEQITRVFAELSVYTGKHDTRPYGFLEVCVLGKNVPVQNILPQATVRAPQKEVITISSPDETLQLV